MIEDTTISAPGKGSFVWIKRVRTNAPPEVSGRKAMPHDLIELIQWRIRTKPIEHRGRQWAALEQSAYAESLKVDVRTIRRWSASAPIVTLNAHVDGRKLCLMRIGEPDAVPEDEAIAKAMARAYNRELRALRRRDVQTLASLDAASDEAVKLAKLLDREPSTSTKRDWGNMCELARQWPPEIAAAAFEFGIKNWSQTMSSIKLAAAEAGADASRYYRYPLTALMRKYPKAALAPYVLHLQETAPVATHKHGLWKAVA